MSQDKNLEHDMKHYYTQHSWQQFEDPHNSLQQGLAWTQQWLEEDVFVNGGMQNFVD